MDLYYIMYFSVDIFIYVSSWCLVEILVHSGPTDTCGHLRFSFINLINILQILVNGR